MDSRNKIDQMTKIKLLSIHNYDSRSSFDTETQVICLFNFYKAGAIHHETARKINLTTWCLVVKSHCTGTTCRLVLEACCLCRQLFSTFFQSFKAVCSDLGILTVGYDIEIKNDVVMFSQS